MEPSLDVNGRYKRCTVEISRLGHGPVGRSAPYCVPLLDHAEPTELALHPIKVAVMISVVRHEEVVVNAVVGVHSLNTMHGEGQARNPWFAVELVLQIELRR